MILKSPTYIVESLTLLAFLGSNQTQPQIVCMEYAGKTMVTDVTRPIIPHAPLVGTKSPLLRHAISWLVVLSLQPPVFPFKHTTSSSL